MNFGTKLRTLRKENGLTQEALGEKVGKSKNNISQYELDKRRPDPQTLTELARIFGVTIDELLGAPAPRPATPVLREVALFEEPALPDTIRELPVYAGANASALLHRTPDDHAFVTDVAPGVHAFVYVQQDDSLQGSRIMAGDQVLIYENPTPREDDIVLAVCDGHVYLRIYKTTSGKKIALVASNPRYAPLLFSQSRLKILGTATRVTISLP